MVGARRYGSGDGESVFKGNRVSIGVKKGKVAGKLTREQTRSQVRYTGRNFLRGWM